MNTPTLTADAISTQLPRPVALPAASQLPPGKPPKTKPTPPLNLSVETPPTATPLTKPAVLPRRAVHWSLPVHVLAGNLPHQSAPHKRHRPPLAQNAAASRRGMPIGLNRERTAVHRFMSSRGCATIYAIRSGCRRLRRRTCIAIPSAPNPHIAREAGSGTASTPLPSCSVTLPVAIAPPSPEGAAALVNA